jgi:hypothetical protein
MQLDTNPLRPFIEGMEKTANFKGKLALSSGGLDVRVFLTNYVVGSTK